MSLDGGNKRHDQRIKRRQLSWRERPLNAIAVGIKCFLKQPSAAIRKIGHNPVVASLGGGSRIRDIGGKCSLAIRDLRLRIGRSQCRRLAGKRGLQFIVAIDESECLIPVHARSNPRSSIHGLLLGVRDRLQQRLQRQIESLWIRCSHDLSSQSQ